VFNWYNRSEQIYKGSVDNAELGKEAAGVHSVENAAPRHKDGACQLCGRTVMGNTERHLYVYCQRQEICEIREKAEEAILKKVNESEEGVPRHVLQAVRRMMIQEETRHLVWKGLITQEQGAELAGFVECQGIVDLQRFGLLTKQVKECMGIGGSALLAMRKLAWKLGGIVKRKGVCDSGRTVKRGRGSPAVVSIAASLGVMSPAAAILWELERRKRRRARDKSHRDRTLRLPKVFVSTEEPKSSRRNNRGFRRQNRGRDRHRGVAEEKDGLGLRLWDVH